MIYIRLGRIAAVLGFVAFIFACVIPAEQMPPPVSPYPQGQYQQPGQPGPGMMQGGPIEAGCSYNGTQLPGDVGAAVEGLQHVYESPGQVTFAVDGKPLALTWTTDPDSPDVGSRATA